jgi:hypothetical protein
MKVEIKTINVISLKKFISKKLMIETLSKVKNLINFSIIKQLQYLGDHYKSQKVPEFHLAEKCKKMMLLMHIKNNNSPL